MDDEPLAAEGRALMLELKQAAVGLLARREHSRRELLRKLLRRSDDRVMIGGVLDELVERGYLSEERFAESYVRSRVSSGFGPLRIRLELKDRGLSDALIEENLSADFDWCEHLARVSEKKYGSIQAGDRKEREKQTRFFLQRGFSYDQIARLLWPLPD